MFPSLDTSYYNYVEMVSIPTNSSPKRLFRKEIQIYPLMSAVVMDGLMVIIIIESLLSG